MKNKWVIAYNSFRRASSYKPKEFPEAFNFTSGVFTSPHESRYLVTLTANLRNIDDINFAQLFIMNDGWTSKDRYLLVEPHKVAYLNTEIRMNKGDTMNVYVGYHILYKTVEGIGGGEERNYGYQLDAVRLCIFCESNC